MDFHYTRGQMAEAIAKAGVCSGDVVFSHSNVGFFGIPEAGRAAEAVYETILGAFLDVLGEEGTLAVPTFSYSFCRNECFDPDHTASTCGMFTEMLRKDPRARRSWDPIFAVAAVGRRAEELTSDAPVECFGESSFWARFLRADGIICNLNFDAGSTFIHYVERRLNVPYRYDKLFTGTFMVRGERRRGAAVYFCQDLTNEDTVAAFEPFDELARQRGVVRECPVGRGAVVALRAADTYAVIEEGLKNNNWLLTRAARGGRAPVLLKRSDTARFRVALPADASMRDTVSALWRLPRDIISDGYDAALEALQRQVPMKVHEYPTGTHCSTWIVPEKWTCHEARLETVDGRRLFSYEDHPLHVLSYSLPFEGEVSREELLAHLHVHPVLDDAVPFEFSYYDRVWGLCCTRKQREALTEDRYRVVLKTSFSYGTLKVGEIVVPGRHPESIVLCAHLCHPAMVNDDLAGVAVLMDVARALRKRSGLRYTYRFLLVPENIGSIAYLSHHREQIPLMRGGLFLEMLGLRYPHALQKSFAGDTECDVCFEGVLREHDPDGWTGPFRGVILNDEKQFNAPGVRVPMLSLSRVLPRGEAGWPYPEYHSSRDNFDFTDFDRLCSSRDLVLRMLDALERNLVPVNRFMGEVFLSRYGLHVDWRTGWEEREALFRILNHTDGTRTVAGIAAACGLPFPTVLRALDELSRHGLVAYRDPLDEERGATAPDSGGGG